MSEQLFEGRRGRLNTTGILASQNIRDLVAHHRIQADPPVTEDQIQPASIDLRLGPVAYRIAASFLPGAGVRVEDKLERYAMHRLDLADGAVLERGCVYIVPLLEHLALPAGYSGMANPKSSTGRLDVFTRLITDKSGEFETVADGYSGPLYAEISPRTFSILVRQGSRLTQLRLRRGTPRPADARMSRLQRQLGLVQEDGAGSTDLLGAAPLPEVDIRQGVAIRVDLEGAPGTGLIAYRARPHAGLIDVDRSGSCDALDFWDPVYRHRGQPAELVLNPEEFYILMSKESILVPPEASAEMRAVNTRIGEFRAHYAGFFDPGFGMADHGGGGTRAVLEVRSRDVPFLIEDGQTVCRLVYEQLLDVPDKLYGRTMGSNYQGQKLKLSRHFRSD